MSPFRYMLLFLFLTPAFSHGDTLTVHRLLEEGRAQANAREWQTALIQFDSALQEARVAQWPRGEFRALSNSGSVYLELDDLANAYARHADAMKIAQAENQPAWIVRCERDMGNVYFRQEAYDEALAHYQAAKAACDPDRFPAQYARVLNNLGAVRARREEFPEAMQLYTSALNLARKLADRALEAKCRGNLGVLHKRQGNFKRAEEYYREALAIERELNLKQEIAVSLVNIGAVYAVQEDHAGAILYYDHALLIADSIGAQHVLQQIHENLAASYEALGDAARAYRNYKAFAEIRAKIQDRESREALARVRTAYDYDAQQQQLARREAALQEERLRFVLLAVLAALLLLVTFLVFYLRRARATRQRLEIESQLRTFERQALRLQMNPHFIFNALTALGSYIYQQDTATATRFLGQFSRLMRLTLEHAARPLVSLEIELKMLRLYTTLEQARFEEKFEVEMDVEEGLDLEWQLPPMLLQPFVENAILHGLAPRGAGGKLEIRLRRDGEALACTISDNGIGRAAAKGRRREGHQPMGLSITRRRLELLAQQGGTEVRFDIEDLHDGAGKPAGTRVNLHIPVTTD
ncbi:MAG: tetratricopeptide repeat protein [Bacteroidota bacterium]